METEKKSKQLKSLTEEELQCVVGGANSNEYANLSCNEVNLLKEGVDARIRICLRPGSFCRWIKSKNICSYYF